MARRATRNTQQTIYRLYFGPLERIVRRRPFDSERGGGGVRLSNFVWTDNLFSASARLGNFFSCSMGSGKIYFRVNISPQSTALTPLRQLLETLMLLKAVPLR